VKIGIFANGNYGKKNYYLKELQNIDYIIGVDGGNNFLKKIGILPDLCMGDLDSIKPEVINWLKGRKIMKFSKDKDKSDTYLALQKAETFNPKEIFLFGGLGKRIDHTFSNLLLLSKFDFVFKEENIEIFSVKGMNSVRVNCKIGETWSLFPLEKVEGLNINGFKYPIENGIMEIENPYGLSNVTIKSVVKIEVKRGVLIIFRNLKITEEEE
jgi:thiamine pyrophosphokinase